MKTALLIAAAYCTIASAQKLNGRWDGSITVEMVKVPLQLQMTAEGSAVSASWVNGDRRTASIKGSFADGALRIEFASGKLEARFNETVFKGTYALNGKAYSLEAAPYCSCSYEGEAGPDVSGLWTFDDGAATVTLRRQGEDTYATLRRGADEIGPLGGRFDGLQFSLHYFDGVRAMVLELEPNKDGTLAAMLEEPGKSQRKAIATKRSPAK
ncbi:MAG: hypothetical protein HY820_16240 [Acidobacteria bacterium]|nr:hypothetical protein [Acidobacteriota bacterium]